MSIITGVSVKTQKDGEKMIFPPLHHKGTPESSGPISRFEPGPYPTLHKEVNKLQSNHTPPWVSIQISCPKGSPWKLMQMQMYSFGVAIAVIVYNLDNKVASRPLRLTPVPGDVLEQIQPGAQMHPG